MARKEKMVLLEWLDATCTTSRWEWRDETDPIAPHLCKTMGFVVDETPQYITVAQSLGKDHESVMGRMTILKRCIKKRRVFKN
jgi:hypothetical protein